MGRESLAEHLQALRDVILSEREAAKELAVEKMMELTSRKEELLLQISRISDTVEKLTPVEKELSENLYKENLRNAYFLWSALKWVRDSMGFIGDRIYLESYRGNGSTVKGRYSGTLLSGRV